MSMSSKQILIVDDEAKMRRVLEIMLQKMGHRVLGAVDGNDALDQFGRHAVDLVIADLRMPGMDGIGLLASLREQGSDAPVIVITAHGTIDTAVTAMKHGASDYIVRPFDLEVLELAIERALESVAVARQNAFLREEIERGFGAFVGNSAPMQQVYEMIRRVGPSKAPVFITGETGTGKELAARAVHQASPRREALFVPINCAAIPAEMLESELFGYVRGAFTGAVKDRMGKFELADGGTVFLDELSEMPVTLQAKLLRVLQENTIERLGSNRTINLDIRLIAATNRNPAEAVRDGRLREDLYYRINVVAVDLPALRDRREDIPALIDHFIHKHAGRWVELPLGDDVIERLTSYAWPGNVRELENMIERALILCGDGPLQAHHLVFQPARGDAVAATDLPVPASVAPRRLNQAVDELEVKLIESALLQAGGNKARAAAMLDISERTLWYKLRKHRPDQPT